MTVHTSQTSSEDGGMVTGLIRRGSTPNVVQLTRNERGVFVLTMVAAADHNPENRWNLPFAQAIHRAFDAVEDVRNNN